ncbi:GARP transcription factor [Trema orientale]|uniref:GARP transcription factor n=1 Tax=Trema orientale TaxID=63057 RepID=A0A2P5ENF0_TREOI|nr:GARP transcription factor [Trema orientale]
MHCSGMGFREYIEALEVERKKIQVFERELPLCLELVNQKYRLHTRRPTPAIHNNGNAQTPQVVFVGGIWMQPSEYAAAVATATGGAGDPSSVAANGVYAPVAAPPPAIQHVAVHRPQQNRQSSEPSHSEERLMSHSEGGLHSNSPATSSSTHTTTTSPAF